MILVHLPDLYTQYVPLTPDQVLLLRPPSLFLPQFTPFPRPCYTPELHPGAIPQ